MSRGLLEELPTSGAPGPSAGPNLCASSRETETPGRQIRRDRSSVTAPVRLKRAAGHGTDRFALRLRKRLRPVIPVWIVRALAAVHQPGTMRRPLDIPQDAVLVRPRIQRLAAEWQSVAAILV